MGNYRGGEEPRQLTGHSSHYSNMPLGFSAEACWASPHTLLSHKQRHASPFLKTQTITDRCFLANRSSLGQFQGQKRVCRLYSELNMMRSHICFCGICGGENQVSEHTARCGRLTRRRWSVQAGEVRRSAEGGGAGGVGWGGGAVNLAAVLVVDSVHSVDSQRLNNLSVITFIVPLLLFSAF